MNQVIFFTGIAFACFSGAMLQIFGERNASLHGPSWANWMWGLFVLAGFGVAALGFFGGA